VDAHADLHVFPALIAFRQMSKNFRRFPVAKRTINVETDELLIVGVGHGTILLNVIAIHESMVKVVEMASRPAKS
jgi:hypothetical protein